jgi:hypothetical protein
LKAALARCSNSEDKTMRTIDRLKKEARESAEWRGHKLSRFTRSYYGFAAECPCGASVAVSANPPPNGTDIMGDAVAVYCSEA